MTSTMVKLKIILELIVVLMKRWRLKMFTFHFPRKETTIMLEDHFNIDFPIDEEAVIASGGIDLEYECHATEGKNGERFRWVTIRSNFDF